MNTDPNLTEPVKLKTAADDAIAPSQERRPQVFFKHFDGIRFLAALMVVLQHLSDYKSNVPGMPNAEHPWFSSLGKNGVALFFVISGFLIFYLLFKEKEYTGTVKIKAFYVRRILRIWPLYFGFGLASIFLIDRFGYLIGAGGGTPVAQNLTYLFLFAVNLQLIWGTMNRGLVELFWSVSIEEQFYAFAPWLVKKGRNYVRISIWLIAIGIITKFILRALVMRGIVPSHVLQNPLYVFTTCWFDAFGFGILAATIFYRRELYAKVQKYVENRWIQLAVIVLAALYVTNIFPSIWVLDTYFFSTFPAILFSFIMLAAASEKFVINFDYPIFKQLGKYAYGIYVLHSAVLQIFLIASMKFLGRSSTFYYEFVYPIVGIILVIIVAGLSYELFEKHFLLLKKKFTIIRNKPV